MDPAVALINLTTLVLLAWPMPRRMRSPHSIVLFNLLVSRSSSMVHTDNHQYCWGLLLLLCVKLHKAGTRYYLNNTFLVGRSLLEASSLSVGSTPHRLLIDPATDVYLSPEVMQRFI